MKTRMFTKLLAATVMAVSLMACSNGSSGDDGYDESTSYSANGSSTGSSSSATEGSGPTPRTVTTVFVGMNVGTSTTFSIGLRPEVNENLGTNEKSAKPMKSMTLSRNFSICDHEVTQAEYTAVMGTNPSNFTGDDTLPVDKVSWNDAIDYCNRLSQQEGLTPCYTMSGSTVTCNFDANGYRLPTEAEWEYAARAGNTTTDSITWSGTTAESSLGDYAWYSGNSACNGSSMTHPVKTKQPNAKGLYDMSGNVEEWCWDLYTSYASSKPYPAESSSRSDSVHIVRGGCYNRAAGKCSVSFRDSQDPSRHIQVVGFRVCRTVPAE